MIPSEEGPGEMAFRLTITALLWTVWCLAHSLLASEPVLRKTGLLRTRLKPYYRLAYSVFAATSLSFVWRLTPDEGSIPLWSWSGELAAIRIAVVVVALAVGYLSFSSIGFLDFLGLTALGMGRKAAVTSRKLITKGVYGRIRHPQFLAGLLLLWSRDLTDTGLTINVVLSVYLFVGARIEEQKLLTQFGPEYAHYREQVPAFVPKRIV